MPRWLIAIVGFIGLGGLVLLVDVGGWIRAQDDDLATLEAHLKETCWTKCIKRCQTLCMMAGTPLEDCPCDKFCQQECGA